MKKSQSSDYFNRLEKGLGIDEEGNLSIGKNLEVDGTIKLNSGIKPIEIIRLSPSNFQSDLVFNIFVEIPSTNGGIYTFFGSVENYDEQSKYICIGEYSKNTVQGGFNYVQAYYMYDNGTTINIINYDGTSDTVNSESLPTMGDLDFKQDKLYTHTLTLTAGTNNYILMYDCGNELVVNSLQDLRTIMKISSANDSVLLSVVNTTDLSTAGLQVTTSLCKIGTANVTAVTDKVTTL